VRCASLVARPAHARRQHCGAVVGGELGVGRGDLGLIAVGPHDPRLEVVGDDQLGHPAEEGEGLYVGREEALRALVREGPDVGVAAGPEHGHEEGGLPHLAAARVDVRERVAGPVDEELLAGLVFLTHDHVDAPLPGAVVLAEPGVAVAVRVAGAVLLPEQGQGDVLAGELGMHGRPVGRPGVGGGLATGTVEAPLKLAVRDALGQRPGESRRLEAREDLRDGRVRDAHRAGYGALRESRFEGEAQDLPGLPHGQSPVGHRALLVILT